LAQLTNGQGDATEPTDSNGACITENLVRWAQAEALTQMQTSDAYLARDRLVSEILLTLLSSSEIQSMNESDRNVIEPWLVAIADSTIEFYEHRAGDKSRLNNHRYWAGLAVGAIGFFLEKPEYINWGERSYQLGVCQVDESGYLPLELSRGARALEYHVYSLRPLQALAALSAAHGRDLEGQCNGGLKRLRNQTMAALKNSDAISERAGLRQTGHASEASFVPSLHLFGPALI
jgi:Alginate lyase